MLSVEIPNGGIERYSYNDKGLISSVTNAGGVTFVKNVYDEKARIIYQELYNGQEYVTEYDDENYINTFSYPKITEDRTVKYVYDNDTDLPIKVIYGDNTYEEAHKEANKLYNWEKNFLK